MHDVVIRGGTTYDGSGGSPREGDVAIDGDRIAAVGTVSDRGRVELIEIARRTTLPAEIYHLKQAGRANWKKLDEAIAVVEGARAEGLAITADMYPHEAGATGLSSCFPPWAHEGGLDALLARLRNGAQRARVRDEMSRPGVDWENLFLEAGSPDGILLSQFKNERLKPLTGKRLAEVARERGGDARDVAIDLVLEDASRVGATYFMISPDNLNVRSRCPG